VYFLFSWQPDSYFYFLAEADSYFYFLTEVDLHIFISCEYMVALYCTPRNYEEPDDPAKTTHSKMAFVSRPSSFCDCAQTSKRKTLKRLMKCGSIYEM